jgi:O-antigen ligase
MAIAARIQRKDRVALRYHWGWIPSAKIEVTFYFSVAYSVLSSYYGYEIPLVAAAITLGLASYCFKNLASRAKEVYAPIAFLLACLGCFVFVQIVFHSVSISEQVIRDFFLFIAAMVVMQSLCLRKGFSYRFPIVLFFIGLVALPHIELNEAEDRFRAAVELGGYLSTTGGLGQWFSFCALFFAIFGLESKRNIIRMVAWVAAIGCMFVSGLTVSRGPLLGLALGLIVTFRAYLSRAFAPALILVTLIGIVFETGLFTEITSRYEARGMEETGRFLLWPMVLERIAESPLVGVGHAHIATYLPDGFSVITTPHNSFLFFALSSGIVPLAFWIAFWIGATSRSFNHVKQSEYRPYQLPFLIFAFVVYLFGDINNAPWALFSLSVGASPYVVDRRKLLAAVRRILSRRATTSPQDSPEAATAK